MPCPGSPKPACSPRRRRPPGSASTSWWAAWWSWPSPGPRWSSSGSSPVARRLATSAREVLRRNVVEEVLELLDDFLGVLNLMLELDRGLRDHVLGGDDRRPGTDGQRQ